jgi:hypothetical protein
MPGISDEVGQLIKPPKTFDEMEARPAFIAPLDHDEHKLTDVLAPYSFAKQVPCGLRSCRTNHNNGFLVRTQSGAETNIGSVCGRKYFGDDFVIASSVHRRQRARQEALTQATHLKTQQHSINQRIDHLVSGPFGTHWLRRLGVVLQVRLGADGMSLLKKKARTGSYQVEKVSERTEQEIQREMALTRKKRDELKYKSEAVGVMQPMRWLSYDFKGDLIDNLRVPLDALCAMDLQVTETKVIQRMLKAVSGWEQRIETANAVLKEAAEGLSHGNLALLTIAVQSGRPDAKTVGLVGWEQTAEYKELLAGKAAT